MNIFNSVMNRPLPIPQDPYEELPTERIFTNSGVGGSGGPKESIGDYTVYEFTVRALIDDAGSFEESTLAPDREENLEYFYGEIPAPEGEGTSTAVSTDFRDTVMAIIPSLIRIFTSPEHVINCHPSYQGQEEAARQCTDYLQYVFWEENPGFLIIHDILKDALRCKIGVVKWWTDTSEEVTEQTYRNITHEQLQMLIYENDSIEIVEAIPSDTPAKPISEAPPAPASPGMQPEAGGVPSAPLGAPPEAPELFEEVTIRFVKAKPTIKVESVPLDEFRVDRKAKSVAEALLVGHDQVVQVGELIAAGYSQAELEPFIGATATYTTDRQYRNAGIDETNVLVTLDIRYGCYFIRIDKDGDGIPELREIHTVGDNHAIIKDTVVQHPNFAVW